MEGKNEKGPDSGGALVSDFFKTPSEESSKGEEGSIGENSRPIILIVGKSVGAS